MIEKLEISLTQFVDFVNKMGKAKLGVVKSAKNRDECFLQSKRMTAGLRAKFLSIARCLKFPGRHSIIT